jgi:hypothetical protein
MCRERAAAGGSSVAFYDERQPDTSAYPASIGEARPRHLAKTLGAAIDALRSSSTRRDPARCAAHFCAKGVSNGPTAGEFQPIPFITSSIDLPQASFELSRD